MTITEVLYDAGIGRKIRRKCWGKYCFITLCFDSFPAVWYFETQSGNHISLSANAIMANDWEIVKDDV